MNDFEKVQFEMEGGVKGVVLRLLGYGLKWIAIGALIRIGWRIVG